MSAAELYSLLLNVSYFSKWHIVPAFYHLATFQQLNVACVLVGLYKHIVGEILPHEVVRVVYGLHGRGLQKQDAPVLISGATYAFAFRAIVAERQGAPYAHPGSFEQLYKHFTGLLAYLDLFFFCHVLYYFVGL